MEAVFLKVLNLGLSGTWMILAVMLIRAVFRKAPRWAICLLWGLAALRLCCPVSLESGLSLLPSGEPLPPEILSAAAPRIQSGIPVIDNAVNPALAQSMTPADFASANPSQIWSFILSRVWLLGAAAMALYAFGFFLLLRRRLASATLLRENIRQSEKAETPFVLGFFRPVIYLPYSVSQEDQPYVIAHERAHIRRGDHWWKALGFGILAVYWFHPLVWAAYFLFCRDLENACDEKVIREMDRQDRQGYAAALLRCGAYRRGGKVLAFGELGLRERVKRVMGYRRCPVWVVLLLLLAGIAVSVCFLTNPIAVGDSIWRIERADQSDHFSTWYRLRMGSETKGCLIYAEQWSGGSCLRSDPLVLGAGESELSIITDVREENGERTGVDVQLSSQGGGTHAVYFPFPQEYRPVGWSFTARESKQEKIPREGEMILGALALDVGGGVRVFDCDALLLEPERLEKADYMVVIRACFSGGGQNPRQWLDYRSDPANLDWEGEKTTRISELPHTVFRYTPYQVTAVSGAEETVLVEGYPVQNVFFADLTGDGMPEICATVNCGFGMIDTHVVVVSWTPGEAPEELALWDRGTYEYALRMDHGTLLCDRWSYPDGEDVQTFRLEITGEGSGRALTLLR